jgi:uncharacterized Ntn-hydrolase superfamily protein
MPLMMTLPIRLRLVVTVAALLAGVAAVSVVAQKQTPPAAPFIDHPGTFSIIGFDPVTEQLGGAVQSCVFSAGNGVLWGEAGVGFVATQATVDVSYGPQGLALLKQGMAPKDVIAKILADDPDKGLNGRPWPKSGRQLAVMNPKGEYAAHTGETAQAWRGHQGGKFVTAQGNILANEKVVPAMVDAFEKSEMNASGQRNQLARRLVSALEAGQEQGGDSRCQQSAALLIVKKDGGVWLHNDVVLRLQVDDSVEPIKELRRLVECQYNRQTCLSGGGRGRGRGGSQ